MVSRLRVWLDRQAERADEILLAELNAKRRRLQAAGDIPAEVTVETSQPTVPRVAGGILLGGLPGGILAFAWRKKTRVKIR